MSVSGCAIQAPARAKRRSGRAAQGRENRPSPPLVWPNKMFVLYTMAAFDVSVYANLFFRAQPCVADADQRFFHLASGGTQKDRHPARARPRMGVMCQGRKKFTACVARTKDVRLRPLWDVVSCRASWTGCGAVGDQY